MMGRTNDALIYTGEVHLYTYGVSDNELGEIITKYHHQLHHATALLSTRYLKQLTSTSIKWILIYLLQHLW